MSEVVNLGEPIPSEVRAPGELRTQTGGPPLPPLNHNFPLPGLQLTDLNALNTQREPNPMT